MSSTFPSVITVYTDPNPTDKLNSPSHSGVERNQNSGLKQVEAVIGTTANTIGTISGDLRNSSSDGGGHVQTANRGGTGQTTYAKGDLLVGQSTSMLTKLSAGLDGQAVIADSSKAAGLSYQGVATATNIQNQTYTYAQGSVISASVYGVNLGQAVSVLTAGQAFQVKFPTTNTTSVLAFQVNATGPSSIAARIKNPDLSNPEVGSIKASMIGILEYDGTQFQLISRNASGSSPYATGFGSASAATVDGAGHQVANDSMIFGYQAVAGGAPTTDAFADSASTPTTQVAKITGNNAASFSFVVKKNDYYKISAGGGATVTAYIVSIT